MQFMDYSAIFLFSLWEMPLDGTVPMGSAEICAAVRQKTLKKDKLVKSRN